MVIIRMDSYNFCITLSINFDAAFANIYKYVVYIVIIRVDS
jgi:hypothetical protein